MAAFTEKRNATFKASSQDADHPLIKAANAPQRENWDLITEYNFGYCNLAVSYTHLTLPTKA